MGKPIYLDYNGTTPLDPGVAAAMRVFEQEEFGNPSSSHWYGIQPKRAVDTARSQAAYLLGCKPSEIIFTSGGTESNNHAIIGTVRAYRNRGAHIVTSMVEHPAVLEVCKFLESEGADVTYLPVDEYGLVSADDATDAIRHDTVLVTIMHANNEVGTIQPIEEIARAARTKGVAIHTDAAQSVGKIPTNVDALAVDLLTVAGHKLYAPKGVGALYIREPLRPDKFMRGAGQERGLRAGTENVTGIVGLGEACEISAQTLEAAMVRMRDLRDRLHHGIVDRVDDAQLNGHPEKRLPNTLSLSFRGLEANRLLEEIGLEVAASAGAACHADQIEISHVLRAMNVDEEWAMGTLRFSVGRMTSEPEIDKAVEVITTAVKKLRG